MIIIINTANHFFVSKITQNLLLLLLLSLPFCNQHVQLWLGRLPEPGGRRLPVPGLRGPRRRGLDEEAGFPLPQGEGDLQHVQEQRRG